MLRRKRVIRSPEWIPILNCNVIPFRWLILKSFRYATRRKDILAICSACLLPFRSGKPDTTKYESLLVSTWQKKKKKPQYRCRDIRLLQPSNKEKRPLNNLVNHGKSHELLSLNGNFTIPCIHHIASSLCRTKNVGHSVGWLPAWK